MLPHWNLLIYFYYNNIYWRYFSERGDTFLQECYFTWTCFDYESTPYIITSSDRLLISSVNSSISMSSGERPERIQTLPAQKTALREFFTKENAQTWLSKLRNKFFRTLILLPEFNNLTTLHISYQWRKFSAEYIVRRQVGAKYFRASLIIATIEEVKEIIFDIMCNWMDIMFEIMDNVYVHIARSGIVSSK
jgi:hypothetical protein